VPDEPVTRDQLLHARVQIPAHVVLRAFPTETVLLNLTTGYYHGLNPTAGRMLELLGASGSVVETARTIADEYGQPLDAITSDVTQLCLDLCERGLLELATAPAG
jgi:hypothetical protein